MSAGTPAFTQLLAAKLEDTPIRVQVVCPGIVATEFHTVQGMDLSSISRMSAEDVVTASIRGIQLGEDVTAPGVEDASLLDAVFSTNLEAFGAQSPELAVATGRTEVAALNDQSDEQVRRVGFIGLGDQGLQWRQRSQSPAWSCTCRYDGEHRRTLSARTPYIHHGRVSDLAGAVGIEVGTCMSTDKDILGIAGGGLLKAMRAGTVVVNHGSGVPRNATRLLRRDGGGIRRRRA